MATKTTGAIGRTYPSRRYTCRFTDNVLGLLKLPSHVLLCLPGQVRMAPGMVLYIMPLTDNHACRSRILPDLVAENIKLRSDFIFPKRPQDTLKRTHRRRTIVK